MKRRSLHLLLFISFVMNINGTAQPQPDAVSSVSNKDSISLMDVNNDRLVFSGRILTGDSTRLFWQYSGNADITYFELERSADNQHFEPVLLMHAKGTSRNAAGYSFIDYSTWQERWYYRLRVEEQSGKETYLNIRLLPTVENSLANK